MKPQSREILGLLRRCGPDGLTQQEAIRWADCYRLAARISDLRADGFTIRSLRATDSRGHVYARYYLEEQPEQLAAFG